MFKKPKRNFRGRRTDSEEQGGTNEEIPENGKEQSVEVMETDQTDDNTTKVAEKQEKLKKKKKKPDKEKGMGKKTSSVLSFEEDEGDSEDVFQIKKSSHTKKITKQLKKQLQQEKMQEELRQQKHKKETRAAPCTENGSSDPAPRTPSPGPGSDIDFSDNEEPTFIEKLRSGEIPDASIIHAIRKKRQMAREMGDFIAVDDTVKYENDKSRLIREDENDESDEERVNFTVSGPTMESDLRRMQQTILEAHEESHSEGSDQEWEKQQILKGVSIPVQQPGNGNQDDYSYGGYQQYMFGNQAESPFSMVPDQPYQASAPVKRTIPVSDLPKINMELVMKRLRERLEEMTTVHRTHAQERDDMASRLETCEDDIATMSGKVGSLESQYRFFQEMRGYVTDLVECLSEKTPQIQYLERSLLKVWQKRAEKLVQRRQQDIKDESHDSMMSMSKSAADPTLDPEKQRRIAEREARRTRRRKKREKHNLNNHQEGVSTDDEQNPSELAHYNSEKDRISTECTRLFEDVEEEFSHLGRVKHRFERWRNEQGESYHDAYIALCLPKLFTPFVKLKLTTWNPLEFRCADFQQEPWYETLMFYGYQENRDVVANDDDLKVMPNIIEKVLVPKLTGLAETCWDPMFTRQTQRLVSVVTHFLTQYPTLNSDSKHTKALVKAVVNRIRRTLDDDVFMPLYPKQLLENKGPASTFFYRQLNCCIKLLGNIMLWNGIISTKPLQEMALDALLNRYITLGLQNSTFNQEAINRCQNIINQFPKSWFESLDGESTIPQLESLCRYLSQSVSALEASSSKEDQWEARDMCKQITKMLLNIHALDHAMAMASKYSLKLSHM